MTDVNGVLEYWNNGSMHENQHSIIPSLRYSISIRPVPRILV